MTKEQFVTIGLTEEQAKKAAEESEKELKNYVEKQKFEELNTENQKLQEVVKKNEADLENLKKSAGNSGELLEQIKKVQQEAKEAEEKHREELKEIRMTNAIKIALAGKAQDEELVAGLFDKSKMLLGEDGKVTGLEEQLKALKENKAFLFKDEQPEQKPGAGFYKLGADPSANASQGSISLKDALTAVYSK